jgi:hypothetical protein
VLFSTADPLVATDVDGVQRDIYDARTQGGFPLPVAAESDGCKSESCESPSSEALVTPIPSSMGERGEAPIQSPAASPTKPQKQSKKFKRRGKHPSHKASGRCKKKTKASRIRCERNAASKKDSARKSGRSAGRSK